MVRSGVDGVVVVGVSDHLAHSTLADDARVTAPAATTAAPPKIDLARDQIVAAQLTARSLARSLVRDKSRTQERASHALLQHTTQTQPCPANSRGKRKLASVFYLSTQTEAYHS